LARNDTDVVVVKGLEEGDEVITAKGCPELRNDGVA
jgi:hypothetical protein